MSNLQQTIDRFWQATVIKILPQKFSADHLTAIRIFLIPVIIYFIATGNFLWAFWIFVLAALSDTLDGALARSRQKFSRFGLAVDPIADKLLMVLVLVFLIPWYQWPALILISLILDLLALIVGILVYLIGWHKKFLPANFWGKAKMFCQVLGVLAILIGLAWPWPGLLFFSAGVFALAIIFEIIARLSYIFLLLKK